MCSMPRICLFWDLFVEAPRWFRGRRRRNSPRKKGHRSRRIWLRVSCTRRPVPHMTALRRQLASWSGFSWRSGARRGHGMTVNVRDKQWGAMLDEIHDFGCARFVSWVVRVRCIGHARKCVTWMRGACLRSANGCWL